MLAVGDLSAMTSMSYGRSTPQDSKRAAADRSDAPQLGIIAQRRFPLPVRAKVRRLGQDRAAEDEDVVSSLSSGPDQLLALSERQMGCFAHRGLRRLSVLCVRDNDADSTNMRRREWA
jgi:hypothetical protein